MNIAIESHVLNHPRRSGLMTYTEGLVRGLYENDHEENYSLLYYSLTRWPNSMPGPEGRNFHKKVLKVPDRMFQGRQMLIDKVALPMFFSRERTKVFHRVCGYTMPAVKGVFKVLTVHDLRTLTIGDQAWAQNVDHYKKALNSLDACVVVSECTKQDLLKHFRIDEHKVKVIYLGADKRFQPASAERVNAVKNKYNIREPFLLSIGSVPRKNIEGILYGFAGSVQKNRFVLVLSCNCDIAKYRGLAQSLGIESRVMILDKLTDEEVVALYSGCHCFVYPSLYEGFGLPILEAMQCGAAVLTSNMSSCPEVAGDAAVLVDPNNMGQISEGINQVCGSESFRQDLIRRGFQRAKLFNWDKYAQQIKEVYALA